MSSLPAGVYLWSGGTVAPSIPYTGPPDPGYTPPEVPDQPGAQGEDFLAAVGGFPHGKPAVVLWGARVDVAIKDRSVGPNTCKVTCSASPVNMRILGIETGDADVDRSGLHVYDVGEAVGWELLVGSNLDGLVRWRFVVRDAVVVDGGLIEVNGVGFTGGLTSDRVIGAPERKNLLTNWAGQDAGSFELGDLSGWTVHGAGTAGGVVAGGVDGSYAAWVTGTPDAFHYLERRVPYNASPAHAWGRARMAGETYVKLPSALDIDGYTLVTVGVETADGSAVLWPSGGIGSADSGAGNVDSAMVRGDWTKDPVVGFGYLPTPPFPALHLVVRLHPVDETARVYYDGVNLFGQENTTTETAVDLTKHVKKLLEHAQGGRDKFDPLDPAGTKWGVGYAQGELFGTSEIHTWWHADGQSLEEAFNELGGRGVEIFDLAGPGRRICASARRGYKRTDLALHEWDLLGAVRWQVDPGGQRSALRVQSGANSVWGGSDVGAIDTSHSKGLVIDVTMSAPVGMTPTKLRSWAQGQLGTLKLEQVTATVLVPWRVGRRVGVGDTLQINALSGSAALRGWFRVSQWQPDFDQRFVAVDVGQVPAVAA